MTRRGAFAMACLATLVACLLARSPELAAAWRESASRRVDGSVVQGCFEAFGHLLGARGLGPLAAGLPALALRAVTRWSSDPTRIAFILPVILACASSVGALAVARAWCRLEVGITAGVLVGLAAPLVARTGAGCLGVDSVTLAVMAFATGVAAAWTRNARTEGSRPSSRAVEAMGAAVAGAALHAAWRWAPVDGLVVLMIALIAACVVAFTRRSLTGALIVVSAVLAGPLVAWAAAGLGAIPALRDRGSRRRGLMLLAAVAAISVAVVPAPRIHPGEDLRDGVRSLGSGPRRGLAETEALVARDRTVAWRATVQWPFARSSVARSTGLDAAIVVLGCLGLVILWRGRADALVLLPSAVLATGGLILGGRVALHGSLAMGVGCAVLVDRIASMISPRRASGLVASVVVCGASVVAGLAAPAPPRPDAARWTVPVHALRSLRGEGDCAILAPAVDGYLAQWASTCDAISNPAYPGRQEAALLRALWDTDASRSAAAMARLAARAETSRRATPGGGGAPVFVALTWDDVARARDPLSARGADRRVPRRLLTLGVVEGERLRIDDEGRVAVAGVGTLRVARHVEIGADGARVERTFDDASGLQAVTAQPMGQTLIMESRAAASTMGRMLLDDPASLRASGLEIVADRAPWIRIFRVRSLNGTESPPEVAGTGGEVTGAPPLASAPGGGGGDPVERPGCCSGWEAGP